MPRDDVNFKPSHVRY